MEHHEAREQRADGPHRCDNNTRMNAPLRQVGVMQRHKIVNVVGDEDPSGCRTGLEQRGIRPSLLLEVVDVVGIDTPRPQLRGEGRIHVFIEEER